MATDGDLLCDCSKYLKPIIMKTYVKQFENKTKSYMEGHIKVGDSVIVVDGSYMTNKAKQHITGIQFLKQPHTSCTDFELLKVVKTNVNLLPTNGSHFGDVLSYSNNCVIEDAHGHQFYCSKINIRRFEQ